MATHLIVGCGYLGRRVAALWLGQGERVLAVTRGNAAALSAAGIEPLTGDVLQPASLHLPAVDTVLYAVGFDRAAGASFREVYLTGLANVLSALPTPRRFVYVSSASVYGQQDGGWVDEAAATEPVEDNGRVIRAAEVLLQKRLPAAVVLRFAGIYGPGRLLRQRDIQAGVPLAVDPEKWLNLIHVTDGAAAVVAAGARAAAGQILNVADDEPVRRRDFYTELATVLAAPPVTFVPPPADTTGRHDVTNRRIANGRLHALGVPLTYPHYRAGLRAE